MSDQPSLAAAAEEIRMEARAIGALVIPALPGGRKMSETVAVQRSDLIALIRHLTPKLIYLDEVRFDAVEHLADLVDGDQDLVDHPDVRSAAKRWRHHDGKLCQYIAVVAHDGIQHAFNDEVEWMDQLRAVAAELRTKLDERAASEDEKFRERADAEHRQERERDARELQVLVREKATILGADLRFGTGKVTKAKRRHLATLLFPDLPSAVITKIVDEAVGSEWLRDAGG